MPVFVEQKGDVKHQPHYEGLIEPIEYMQSVLTYEEFCGYLNGNVIKYVSRYREKNGVEDLEKAQVYLQWLHDAVEQGKDFELFPERKLKRDFELVMQAKNRATNQTINEP